MEVNIMAVRPIPEGSTEIQTGLGAAKNHYTFNGQPRMRYDLYSAEGYCFWEVENDENYDEYGELLPLEQRIFAQYARTPYTSIDVLNENFISVPVQDGYEIVSAGTNYETA
jgi:hypothetical protein